MKSYLPVTSYTLNLVLCVNLASPLLTPIRPKSRLDLSQKSNLRGRFGRVVFRNGYWKVIEGGISCPVTLL